MQIAQSVPTKANNFVKYGASFSGRTAGRGKGDCPVAVQVISPFTPNRSIMLRTVKPKNARSKRALEARAPKEVEDPRTTIFVRGTHTGALLDGVMKDLMALKRPEAISFSKKNDVRPFEDASSLEFWAQKNDASFFIVGQTTKKRPNSLTLVRTYDSRVLDMCELGVEGFQSIASFKTPKCTAGHKPMLHFASPLFDTHPRFIQLRSLLISFFNGEQIDAIHLAGLEHVISVSLGPTPATSAAAPQVTLGSNANSEDGPLPKVHIRAYTMKLLSSGTKVPRVELTPMGPSLDLVMRRQQTADPELMKAALKRPKVAKKDIESGLGKKRKNLEVDEMGDLRGRVHVARQDLSTLQTRKMKGLKKGVDDETEEMDVDMDEEENSPRSKKKRTA